MREIHISNTKNRNSKVNLGTRKVRARSRYVDDQGRSVQSARTVKGTLETDFSTLTTNVSPEDLSAMLIAGDPEIDIELFGKRIDATNRLYLNADNEAAYGVVIKELVYDAQGNQTDERDFQPADANINQELPLKLNEKLCLPKSKAIRMFVFTACYQISHRDGLTYDFLFDMAKDLEAKGVMMMLGAGDKANQPLVINRNGTALRGFLEGRTQGDKYMLLLHMTNLEMKPLPKAEEENP